MRVAASQPRENHRLKSNASGCEAAIQIILGVPIFILWYEANPCWAPWFRYIGVGASGVTSPPPSLPTQKILNNWTGSTRESQKVHWLTLTTIRTFFWPPFPWVIGSRIQNFEVEIVRERPPDPYICVFWTLRSSNMCDKFQT